jgi:hypothetical protein
MENEIWLPVDGWEGIYVVSNFGRIKSLSRRVGPKRLKERILDGGIDSDGYRIVALCKDGRQYTQKVHRLVCIAFKRKPDPSFNVVCHLDDDRLNNAAENLSWGTVAENNRQCMERNRNCKGTRNGSVTITPFQAFMVQISDTKCTKVLAKALGLAQSTVYGIRNGVTWRWL